MPDIRISQLPAGTVTPASILPAVNGTTTQKITVQQILDSVAAAPGPKGDKGDPGDPAVPDFNSVTPITYDDPPITQTSDGTEIGISSDGLEYNQPLFVGAMPVVIDGQRFLVPLWKE